MELQLFKNTISSLSVIDGTVINQEEVGELIIPDTHPDAERILDAYVSVLLKSKEAQQGSAVIKGVFQTTVIYASDDDNIYKVDLPLPYTVTINKHDIQSECEISAVIRALNTDAVLSDSRKVIVKVNYTAEIRAYEKQNIDFCSKIGDESVYQMIDDVEHTYLNQYFEKTFVVSDDISLSEAHGGHIEIIGAEYKIFNTDFSFAANRLIIRGYGEAELLVLFSDDVCPKIIIKKIDFSQIIDANTEDVIENIAVKVMLNGCYCDVNSYSGDEVSVTIEMHAVAQCEIYCKKAVAILSDAYSTKGNIKLIQNEISMLTSSKTSAASCKICERFDNSANINEIINAKVKILDAVYDNNAVKFKCMIIGYGLDHDMVPQVFRHSFTAEIETECVANAVYNSQVLNIDIFGNEIIFDGEIELKAEHNTVCTMSCIEKAEFEGSDSWNFAPSAVIYCCKSEDKLWNIAKKYLSDVDIIRKINDLEESAEITDGQMILIPKM